jgi:tryptophanyl-tRNA synthetase
LSKARLLTGTRTTGSLHVGHYWGTIRNWIALQNDYECFIGAMDWHGMTSLYKNTHDIMRWNREIIAELIAWGIDSEKTTLFIQSLVPEHLELFIIFANLTPMGWLERVPTWKDSEEENRQADTHSLGRFAYPVLQAADIAIYRGQVVPVGQDQVAHIELSREIIRRCNSLYKLKLPEPKPVLTDTPVLLGLDGRKMSKSYNNGILMTEEESVLKKKTNAMVTDPARVRRNDPGDPEKCSVFSYHKLYTQQEEQLEIISGCKSAALGCGDCKAKLFNNMNKKMQEPREKKKELLNQPQLLDQIISAGCTKARQEAQATLRTVKDAMKL